MTGSHYESKAFLILTYPGLAFLVFDYLLDFIILDKPSSLVLLLSLVSILFWMSF